MQEDPYQPPESELSAEDPVAVAAPTETSRILTRQDKARYNRIGFTGIILGGLLGFVGHFVRPEAVGSEIKALLFLGGTAVLVIGAAFYAKGKARHPAWGLLGLLAFFGWFLSVIALLVLLLLGDMSNVVDESETRAAASPASAEGSGPDTYRVRKNASRWALVIAIISLAAIIGMTGMVAVLEHFTGNAMAYPFLMMSVGLGNLLTIGLVAFSTFLGILGITRREKNRNLAIIGLIVNAVYVVLFAGLTFVGVWLE